jgi:hypothetical protein
MSDSAAYSHSANSSKHNVVFAAWLVSEFGLQCLRTSDGSGIADIAGGAGSLSFEMAVRYGVGSTCIDTRATPTALKGIARRKMRKIHKGRLRARDDSCGSGGGSGGSTVVDRDPLMQFVRGAIALPPDDYAFVPEVVACVANLVQAEEDAEAQGVKGGGEGEGGNEVHARVPASDATETGGVKPRHTQNNQVATQVLPFQYIQASFPSPRCDATIAAASLLCGMHSDQCTEFIVDHALLLRKPFAVVPCCIFKDLYPKMLVQAPPSMLSLASSTAAGEDGSQGAVAATGDANTRSAGEKRLRADGSAQGDGYAEGAVLVSTYLQFVEYLQAKHPRIRSARLPFMGRNVVLYMTEEDWRKGNAL